MRKPINVLIVEDDIQASNDLAASIMNHEHVTLVDVTNDGAEAVNLVQRHLPDVVLLDLELHQGGGNGLTFLKSLKPMVLEHQPYIIVTTNNMSEVTLAAARQLGADFILAKYERDYSADYVIEFVEMMEKAIRKKNGLPSKTPKEATPAQLEYQQTQRIRRELDLIGISPRSVGYDYLIDCIMLTIKNPHVPRLASELSHKYGKSADSIERGMQNAINRAWQVNSIEDLTQNYTAHIRSDKGVPTLMEFIHYYAAKIRPGV